MTQFPPIPRSPILTGPTPLTPLARMSEHLGIDLWIKRDDLAGPSFGGNKARQLEYYFGAAEAVGADTILITGAVQSNFVRTAAAVANAMGMRAVVQLENRVSDVDERYMHSGNVLLDHILGAEVITYPEGEDEAGADRALYAHAAALKAEGRVPYVIPLGADHPPLGALGYRRAAEEIIAEKGDFDAFVVASGSGATHSGLLAGLRGAGSRAEIFGSCVRRTRTQQEPRIKGLLPRLAALDPRAGAAVDADVLIWDGALAPGYGLMGTVARDAIRLMAEYEGIILDPVYTAKAFAAIPALVGDGTIPQGAKVCFVHTGGLAAFFAYEAALRASFEPQGKPA